MNEKSGPEAASQSPAKASAASVPPDVEIWDHPKHGRIYGLPIRGASVFATCLELPGRFVRLDRAADEDFRIAAELSAKRLRRCSIGSKTWWWHKAVIEAADRRHRASFTVLTGGAR